MNPSVLSRSFTVEGGDFLACPLGALSPAEQGRVVEFSLTLRDVLPERRVAAAVTLNELDCEGSVFPRGTRVFTVPPHHGDAPQDIEVAGLRFLLPGDLDASRDGRRRLTADAECHYIDSAAYSLLPPDRPLVK